ncbi:hypothetical protein JOD97_001104 [Duganella sp. 1411]|jgi:hypothetical protein|uniref:hypothetical protein n=1 Tax=Duganella sp. 1411 TaxID=2806572 RepID=UPI001AE1723F|nr:hypothetical protein [Duganella sp. 1411]MBP1203090.1 hypothetical protein [Duganella sp. 1411]
MIPKSATATVVVHLEIDSVKIDITDLFLLDFTLTEELASILEALIVKEKSTSARGRLAEAKQSLCKVLDLIAGRTIEVGTRLAMAARVSESEYDPRPTKCSSGFSPSRNELLTLKARRRDEFVKMSIGELRVAVGERQWTEIQMRLAVMQPIRALYLRRTAQWLLRGLDIRQAVAKACMPARRHRQ